MAPQKFDLVLLGVPLTENPKNSTCLLCQNVGMTRNLVRHYERKHPAALEKLKPKTRTYHSTLMTAEQYIRNIMTIMTTMNIPFSFWDNPAVRENQHHFTTELGIPCSAKNMSDLLSEYAVVIRRKIAMELKSVKLIGLKFDIATRKGRKILGISVQFMSKWHMEIRYLGMVEVTGTADAETLRVLIDSTLKDYDLSVAKIYSCTTDNGGNMLLTATTLMDDIDSAVESADTMFLTDLNEAFRFEDDDEEDDDNDDDDNQNEYSESENEEDELNRTLNCTLDLSRDSIEEPPTVEEALEQAVKVYTSKETRCAAHVIQLAVKDFLKGPRQKFINTTNEKVKTVRKFLRKMPSSLKIKLPTGKNETRWSSSFDMVCTQQQ